MPSAYDTTYVVDIGSYERSDGAIACVCDSPSPKAYNSGFTLQSLSLSCRSYLQESGLSRGTDCRSFETRCAPFESDNIFLRATSPSQLSTTTRSQRRHMTSSPPVTLPANNDVLSEASHMTNTARFLHLLNHARALVRRYGIYTTLHDTTVFCRASTPRSRPSNAEPSITEVFLSLRAAQQAIDSVQPDGAVKDDLHFFNDLWNTTITVLEEILDHGSLPQEPFGWGVFALSTGYLHSRHTNIAYRDVFSNHKYRLRSALERMPSLDRKRRNAYVISERPSMEALVKARREIHAVGHILLSKFRQDGWKRVRWYHAITVTERWIQAFGLVPEEKVEMVEGIASGEGKDVDGENHDSCSESKFP